ncbi:SDR family NAD(P)-dependent oxidoreductase [Rugamonas sp. FT82W]|uniref:SDR family NAD(P)-dependent oxidoreductase n=1 Tax=Duganella vulcania TaxID=2692166 RepID=A0A845GFC1_9BURK|nr:SDR family NAD(P)-dependent oxidoreductase [Duganella vulcania]MYM91469.1 SDR family NAD(P)-dependent oxidoreductase [Duganella vulcania]
MSGRVVFITGAGSGMGQLAAQRALAAGERVIAADVNVVGLDVLGDSPRLLKLPLDVTDPAAVMQAVKIAHDRFGPMDRIIHAAGIMPLGLALQQDLGLIHKIMAVNYGGLVNVSRAALPGMLARGRGEFVGFSSMAGHFPILYMAAYSASKFAVTAFTEVLFHENKGHGVRFACVCPPAVATPLLKQAVDSVWPKMFDVLPVIAPDAVLDKVDVALARGEFWVFPNVMTRVSYVLRRWAPNLAWWVVHKVEGR